MDQQVNHSSTPLDGTIKSFCICVLSRKPVWILQLLSELVRWTQSFR